LALACLLAPKGLRPGDPDLILSQEAHHDWYCSVDRSIHLELAKSGRLLVASEGRYCGDASDHEHGYEDPLLLDLLDTCLDLGDARFQETMAAMTALASPQKEAALWTVFLGLGHQALRTYNDEIRFRPGLPVRLEDQAIDAGVFFGKISEEWLALRRHIVVDLRNEFMARNLVKAYAVAREKGLPLVVVVGANHGEGLKALLERQLGPQVRILTRDSREAFKALFESPSPVRSVAILQRHYGACRPERHGFRAVLAIAERSCGFFLTDAGQKTYRLVGCPKTLATEQVAFGGPQVSGSDWPENELRPLAEPLHGHGMHLAIPCVIL
jgi:hypothetical protein